MTEAYPFRIRRRPSQPQGRVRRGIREIVGNTPLVRLDRVFPGASYELYAKMEGFNPGGSIKDRCAFRMLERAIERGRVRPGGTVIESSSGNMAIGLAQACRYYGLHFVCVVDTRVTAQNLSILRAYGAEIELVSEPDPETGDLLHARLRRVRDLCRLRPGAFCPDQYTNPDNPRAHFATMDEILRALDWRVDYLLCATSTCGTLTGCAEYIQRNGLKTKIIAVDAAGSVIFGGRLGTRLIPGLGSGRRPDFAGPKLVHAYVVVTDLDCVVGCRRLLASEAILVGGSSGGIIAAVERLAPTLAPGAVCVSILPDRGDRYLDTIYSDEWVRWQFGEVSHLWADSSEVSHVAVAGG